MGQCQCRDAEEPPPIHGPRRAHNKSVVVDKPQPEKKNEVVLKKEESNRVNQADDEEDIPFDVIPQVLVVNGRVTTAIPETPDTALMSPESAVVSPPELDIRESLERIQEDRSDEIEIKTPVPEEEPSSSPRKRKRKKKRSNKTASQQPQLNHSFDDDLHDHLDYDVVPMFAPTSLLHLEQLDAAIPEEVDPDAPSDEEEDYEANRHHYQQMGEPGRLIPGSSPRLVRSGRHASDDPNGNILQHPPLLSPPPGQAEALMKTRESSLDSQTMAEYRKLKLQIKLAAHTHKKSKKRDKLQDRVVDVKAYRELWRRFEETEALVKEQLGKTTSPKSLSPRRKRKLQRQKRLFDLHNPETWFFDFEDLMQKEEDEELRKAGQLDNDEDDDMSLGSMSLGSQGSLSLLSAASMESQKRYYAEKQRQREEKDAAVVGSFEKPNIQATLDAMEIMLNNKSAPSEPDDASNTSDVSMSRSVGRRMKRLLRAPTSIKFKSNSKTALSREPPARAGIIPPTEDLSDDESDDDDNDKAHHKTPPRSSMTAYRERNAELKKSPRANRIRGEVDPDFGDDNDYRVSRRRRQYLDPAMESPQEKKKTAVTAVPMVVQEDTALELPSIQRMSSLEDTHPRWRKFSPPSKGIKDSVIASNAAKCLENVYAAMEETSTLSPKRNQVSPSSTVAAPVTKEATENIVESAKRITQTSYLPTGPNAITPDRPDDNDNVTLEKETEISTKDDDYSPKHAAATTDVVVPTSPKAVTPDHSDDEEVLSTPKNSKYSSGLSPQGFSIYNMSTEQFLLMASRPMGTTMSGTVTPAAESDDDRSEKSFSEVVLNGVTNLLSQFQSEENHDDDSMNDLSDIANVDAEVNVSL